MLVRTLSRVLFAGLALAAMHTTAQAQAGAVRGRVADSAGVAIAGAIVTVDGTQVRAQTGAAGTYQLIGVPAGSRTVRVRVIGFVPASATVTVAAAGTVTQDFALRRSAQQLASAVVTGSRAQHTAAEELAVPVDVVSAETIQKQGTTELAAILQAVSPSVNFPR